MRKALLLPALFLIVVTPIAVHMLIGAGTHMTPLLLLPFASPWWVYFPDGYTLAPDSIWPIDTVWRLEHTRLLENVRLIGGCAINAVLLWCVGLLMDKWAARRRPPLDKSSTLLP
jgi:hypothetical protein